MSRLGRKSSQGQDFPSSPLEHQPSLLKSALVRVHAFWPLLEADTQRSWLWSVGLSPTLWPDQMWQLRVGLLGHLAYFFSRNLAGVRC